MKQDFLWWRDGVVYQIYPRSFMDSNGDGIGDLTGITQKLDYLKNLGVDALWLSPIYPTPDVDFGYDVADYEEIDPKFGSMADFEQLLAASHQRGIRVMLDLVLNHTSDQHAWFQESRKAKDNPYRDWYLWQDAKGGGGLPNNWQSRFGGSGWQWDQATQQYYFHMFYKEQPDLNWRNPKVRQAILDMMNFWLAKGVDGFRLDVFNAFFKSPGLENNPGKLGLAGFDRQQHIYDIDQPEMINLLAEMRELLDSYPERYAVGETFMGTPERAAIYSGSQALHATFDFSFLHNRYSAGAFNRSIHQWENLLSERAWPNYVLNNHDVPRSATRYTRNEADERLKVLAGMMLTLRGTPYLYYGEEIGMRDITLKNRAMVQDPVGKHYWPFYKGRDGCRSPMQWQPDTNGGFTSGTPWLPQHANVLTRNVAAQETQQDALLPLYRSLLRVRKNSSALQGGFYQPLTFDPRRMLAYLRQDSEQTVLVALNFSRRKVKLFLSTSLARTDWQFLYSTHRSECPKIHQRAIQLEPFEVLLLSDSNA
ncbi:MAG: hypothetical protein CVU39_11030 [Chloroflexi bacterium HGW-Chloroflexi-10]|nr:MAG: hypothetical protein CVU39_11030 [Chloroflexi bacterium HGW-Chloroflexi-10]